MDDMIDAGRRSAQPGKRGLSRWVVLLGVLAIAAALLSIVFGGDGDRSGSDLRAATAAIQRDELAAVVGDTPADLVRVNPPVDVDAILNAARTLPMVDVPMPDSRYVETYRSRASGQEVTQAYLWYDDPAEAAQLDALAERYLASALGLDTEPVAIDGLEDARHWTGAGYEALSFRSGGIYALVAATTAEGGDTTSRLADKAQEQMAQVRPTLEAAATATAAASSGKD